MKAIMTKRVWFRRSENMSSIQRGQGSVLTCDELRRFQLILNGDDKSYQLTSYDLRLGSCHYVFNHPAGSNTSQDKSESRWQLIHIGSDEELSHLNENSESSQKYEVPKALRHTLTIPPYGSAIIELKETVDTYTAAVENNKLIIGRFDLKLSQVYQALISQQATQVEPLYCGKLYCFIHNLSGRDIFIREGEKIATIEFSYAGEQLKEEERKALINSFLEEKEPPNKYNSPYATEDKRGIKEVRWFYEQGRLPFDCGLNGLYSDVEKKVTAVKGQFEQEFNIFFEKDKTITKIAERVQSRIREQQRNLEILVTVVTGAASLGVGSLLWIFYQELTKLISRQEFINTYLSGKDEALAIGQGQIALEHSPWLLPYAIFIILVIFSACAIYYYAQHKGEIIDQEIQNVIQRELKSLADQVSTKLEEVNRMQRICAPLEKMQDDLSNNHEKFFECFSKQTIELSDLSEQHKALAQKVQALEKEFSRLSLDTSRLAGSESPQTPGGDNS